MKDSKRQYQKDFGQEKKHAEKESALLTNEQNIQKEQGAQEAVRETKRLAAEPARLAREQKRSETDQAREQKIQEEQAAQEAKRETKRLAEEPAWLDIVQKRRETKLAEEQTSQEKQKARKQKTKNQPPE